MASLTFTSVFAKSAYTGAVVAGKTWSPKILHTCPFQVSVRCESKVSGDLAIRENSNILDATKKYSHLWVQCEKCYGLIYKKSLKSKMNICEQCGCYLKMSSSDRIKSLIDPGTWVPMDEDMVSLDPIDFHSEDEPYKDRIDIYQRKTGLTEGVQTGIGQIDGIQVAIGVMDFQFMGVVWDLLSGRRLPV